MTTEQEEQLVRSVRGLYNWQVRGPKIMLLAGLVVVVTIIGLAMLAALDFTVHGLLGGGIQ